MRFETRSWRSTLSLGSRAALLGLSALLAACVYAPENDSDADQTDLTFQGFAQASGATIQIESFSNRTNQWVVVGHATSGTLPVTYGGETLYPWNLTHWNFLTDVPDSACFWNKLSAGACFPQSSGSDAQFRFKELGTSQENLVTFDRGGTDCVRAKVKAGEDWFAAGYHCMSSASPVLTLHHVN